MVHRAKPIDAMQLVTADKIAAVMGLAKAPRSMAALEEMVASGLPKSALKASVARVAQLCI